MNQEIALITQLTPVMSLAGAFLLAFFCIPVVQYVSDAKHLVDEGGKVRKLHTRSTSYLGGVAIFFAIIIAFNLFDFSIAQFVPYVTVGITGLFFTGLKDDLVGLSPIKKLSAQIVASAIVILGADVMITDFGGMFGIHTIPWWAGFVITLFTMIVVINAFNLIDGIDGLAGTIGVVVFLFFGAWFWMSGLQSKAVLCLAVVGALVAFLYYNREPASIFMGDNGSLIIGFLAAFISISFVQEAVANPALMFHQVAPALVLAVLIVPLYDTLRVFIIRAWRTGSPFRPDRTHVHYQLLDVGFSHTQACLIIASINILIIGGTVALSDMNPTLLFGVVLGLSIIMFPTVMVKRSILQKMGYDVDPALRFLREKGVPRTKKDEPKLQITKKVEVEKEEAEKQEMVV